MAKKQLKDKSSTVLLLLDEAEVGFHPEWQKRFVYYLVDFLNAVFKGFKVQVVIATHSPLVLSDFPKERVHLFRRTDEEVVRGSGFGTFAQSIPELLANEFFIDTTLIGDFSKKYIDDILKQVNREGEKINSKGKETLENRIDKIDEPVIKKLLLDVLLTKLDVKN